MKRSHHAAVLTRRSLLQPFDMPWAQLRPTPRREEDALGSDIPVPSDRLVGIALGVALLGAAVALIALLVVLVVMAA